MNEMLDSEFAPRMESGQSREIGELAAAMAKAQASMEGAAKDSDNPFFKSKYADLESVWSACRKALTSNGMAVVQTTEFCADGVIVVTTLIHSSGQWMRGRLFMPLADKKPQAFGSAMTYARRYALAAIAGVYQVDDDAEAAEGRTTQTRRREPKGQPAEETESSLPTFDGIQWPEFKDRMKRSSDAAHVKFTDSRKVGRSTVIFLTHPRILEVLNLPEEKEIMRDNVAVIGPAEMKQIVEAVESEAQHVANGQSRYPRLYHGVDKAEPGIPVDLMATPHIKNAMAKFKSWTPETEPPGYAAYRDDMQQIFTEELARRGSK